MRCVVWPECGLDIAIRWCFFLFISFFHLFLHTWSFRYGVLDFELVAVATVPGASLSLPLVRFSLLGIPVPPPPGRFAGSSVSRVLGIPHLFSGERLLFKKVNDRQSPVPPTIQSSESTNLRKVCWLLRPNFVQSESSIRGPLSIFLLLLLSL